MVNLDNKFSYVKGNKVIVLSVNGSCLELCMMVLVQVAHRFLEECKSLEFYAPNLD